MIYKKGERENLKNWRPLTLLNVDYKIIAKCFALRFKPLLPSLINSNQKGYVNGRYIHESNRLIQDIITYADTENMDGLIVFLDQTKAFDRIEWPWVKLCLQRFGFGEKTVQWVNMLLKSSQTAIQTNGFVSEFFSISRSIKQGCPVAPILYILQAEAIACAVRNDTNIEGLNLPIHENIQLCIKLNQYVDDTQFFLKNENSLPHLFKQLKLYESASGAKMNKEKTTGLFIGKSKKKIPTFNEINWTKTHVKTLGVCHGYEIENNAIWLDKINKIKNCLQVWKSRDLTYKGKILVLKTFVLSKINFELEMRGIPNNIKNDLQTIMTNFLWNDKKPLVSKKTICQSSRAGGLDMIDINSVIQCMQVKTIYKILNSKLDHWNAIGKSYLKIADSVFNQQYFVCYCSSVDGLKCLYQSKIPIFYKNAISSWTGFKRLYKPENFNDVINFPIFGNHEVCFSNKPIFFQSF